MVMRDRFDHYPNRRFGGSRHRTGDGVGAITQDGWWTHLQGGPISRGVIIGADGANSPWRGNCFHTFSLSSACA